MELIKDRAILVGLELLTHTHKMSESLDELEKLGEALNITTVDKIIQRTEKVSPKFYVGSGKVEEIKKAIDVLEATMVIFDDPLSPAQIKNLEAALEIQVIDRSFLILSIFAERATSRQSILEVSLAQKQYMLPRLVGLGKSLSRQGGGTYNAKGPGETKLEMDRRKLLTEISMIKRELAKLSSEREVSRKRRLENHIPIVALVGYTNVGKSSLMNTLSEKLNNTTEEVFEKDMLFATLDTKTKRMQKENYPPFLLVDTVGFIKKLPHELIRSFESTLLDVIDADLIIFVADGAYFNQVQLDSTNDVLTRIGANTVPKIYVLTKSEIALSAPIIEEDYIFLSNVTKENIDTLIDTIYGHLFQDSRIVELKLPFDKSNIFSYLKDNTTIIKTEFLEDGYLIKTILSKIDQDKYKQYIQ